MQATLLWSSTALPVTLAISISPNSLGMDLESHRRDVIKKKNPVCAWISTDSYSLHLEELCFFINHPPVHKDTSLLTKSESYRKLGYRHEF